MEMYCKKCDLIYQVWGSRKRCDICNHKLQAVSHGASP